MLVYAARMPRQSAVPALAAAALASAFGAGPARAAPLRPADPRLFLVLEGIYAVPGGEPSRGGGAGLRLGYRVNDQVRFAGGLSSLLSHGQPVTLLSAGFEAVLDATPIAPFLEVSFVRADPVGRVGYSLATRSGFGADWRLSKSLALGAVVRYFTPLDADGPLAGSAANQYEFALRFVVVPGLLR